MNDDEVVVRPRPLPRPTRGTATDFLERFVTLQLDANETAQLLLFVCAFLVIGKLARFVFATVYALTPGGNERDEGMGDVLEGGGDGRMRNPLHHVPDDDLRWYYSQSGGRRVVGMRLRAKRKGGDETPSEDEIIAELKRYAMKNTVAS